jgi:hypothetical protein
LPAAPRLSLWRLGDRQPAQLPLEPLKQVLPASWQLHCYSLHMFFFALSIYLIHCFVYLETQISYKTQLQIYVQKRGKQLPSYRHIQEGPSHAPLFKSIVTIDGQTFESPQYCHARREAEAAAKVALESLHQEAIPPSISSFLCFPFFTYGALGNLELTCLRLLTHLNIFVYFQLRSSKPTFKCRVHLNDSLVYSDKVPFN